MKGSEDDTWMDGTETPHARIWAYGLGTTVDDRREFTVRLRPFNF